MKDQRPSNARQRESAAYRLAAADPDFIFSESMRGARFMMEFAKADEVLRDWRVASTVVVFGSSRSAPDGPGDHARWYAEARRFAAAASAEGGAMGGEGRPRRNVIATGGGPGLMAAANRGAADVGAPSIGFNISLPREQEPNAWSTPELTFRFHYFAMRKMHLAMRAAALVVFPGGFGTLDELFEVLTLRQTGKMAAIPVVLVDESHWRRVIDFGVLAGLGLIDPADVDRLRFARDGAEAWLGLKSELSAPPHDPDQGDARAHAQFQSPVPG